MPAPGPWLAFVAVAIVMVATPGPNMLYLVSRSLSQGTRAGLISLAGIGVGFLGWMLCAVLGITAMLIAVPYAYDALRLAGAAYLAWLAWTALKPGGRSPFDTRVDASTTPHSPRKLFAMGLVTNLLNPKAAVLYLSLLPHFIDPARGSVLAQGLALGFTQIAVSMVGNGLVAIGAGRVARVLARRPRWLAIQRWIMGSALGVLAARMAIEAKR